MGEKLHVVAGPTRVSDLSAVAEVMAGVRYELGRAGALAAGPGYPRVVVEVLRLDERGTGIAATPVPGSGDFEPLARGAAVGVVARAWVERNPGGDAVRDTGDVRRAAQFGASEVSSGESQRYQRALRAAGRAVGRALAERVLGLPTADMGPL